MTVRTMAGVWFGMLAMVLAGAGCAVDADDGASTGEETVETTDAPLKWKPLPDPWVDCEVNGQICRCSGDVIDCRFPKPIPKKEASVLSAW